MASPTQTKRWILANPPTKEAILSGENATFRLETAPLGPPKENQVLVKTLYLSNDPAQRGWIDAYADPERLYVPPVPKGAVMRAFAICNILASRSPTLHESQLVYCTPGWTQYAVLDAKECRIVAPDPSAGIKATHFLGALGGPGLTAYYGLTDIGQVTAADTLVVSGAAGATGSMVVQLAKHVLRCQKVIGIAGGAAKCRWVEQSLGADVCVDYKSPSFQADLWAATQGFVDAYFDNVGGKVLSLLLKRVKRFGRVVACGAIAQYNDRADGEGPGVGNWMEIITNRLVVRGFLVLDAIAAGKSGEMVERIVQAVKEGKVRLGEEAETVVKARLEDVPRTWMGLFEGRNQGKLVTELVE